MSKTPLQQVAHGPLRSYGRIKSRPIKARQAALLGELLPRIAVPDGPVEARALMPGASATWLEIGFGGGEHLAAQAARHPDVLFLGVEPFLNGIASAVRHVDEGGLENVRLLQGDARELAPRLPEASVERVFILFPDPWPKARHHKRRIIQPEFLDELARVLAPGGRLRFASDVASYVDQALERVLAHGAFDWPALRAGDWTTPPADHVTTRYEEKRLGDCAPVFLDFVRR